MKKLNLLYLLICTLIFGACKDDTFGDYGEYSEGQPAILMGSISVPTHKKVASRAMGAERETAIEQLAIIGWERTSGRKIAIDLTGKVECTNWETNGASVYKLTEDIETKTGHYRAYFIANWKSFYGRKDNTKGTELTFEELSNMSEKELQQIIFWNFGDHIELYGNDGFPMTQVIDELIIDKPKSPDGKKNTLTGVNLTRASAHIHFKIHNETDPSKYTDNNLPHFLPQRFAVFRVPSHANAFFKEDENNVQILKEDTFDQGYFPITATPDMEGEEFYEFDFHMLENRQPDKEGLSSIADRERWDHGSTTPNADLGKAATSYADRKFTNAPEGATFVVIEGTYSGPAETNHETNKIYNSDVYTGNVTYIIHLGNFKPDAGPEGHKGSWGDFSVLRNELQEITITVEGAHQIKLNVDVTEAGEENPAVEGDLSSNPIANLDAHYSKIMLRINPDAINSEDITKNKVAITSYKNGFTNTLYSLADLENEALDIDYKWVQFQKPGADLNVFPKYAGEKRHTEANKRTDRTTDTYFGYITDLIRDIAAYKADNTHQLQYAVKGEGADNNFYTAAFVDENVYYDRSVEIRAWAGLNAKSRRIALNPENRKSSPSGTSILSGVSSINIRQMPVISPYSLIPSLQMTYDTYNPFGFEHEMAPTATYKSLKPGNESLRPKIDGITLKTDNDNDYYQTYKLRYENRGYWWDSPITLTSNQTEVYASKEETRSQLNTRELFPAFDAGEVEDDYETFYKLNTTTKTYEFVPGDHYNTATKALVVNNRDINGNGKIEGAELRWYIPGYVQYLIFSYADNLIPENERMQQRANELEIKRQFPKVDNFDLVFPRYLTSSSHIRRIYWHEQRGAASYLNRPDVDKYNTVPEKRFTPQINHIRLVRNLGQFDGAEAADYTYMSQHNAAGGTEKKHNIRYLNQNIARNYNVTGFYPFHYCTDEYNLLPRAQEYNTKLLRIWGSKIGDGFDKGDLIKTNASNPEQGAMDTQQAIYDRVIKRYEAEFNVDITDGKLPDGWRVPNQRELLSLYVVDAPATLLRELLDEEDGYEHTSAVIFDKYTKSEFLTCSFVRPDLYSTRYNQPIVLSGGVITLPADSYSRDDGYVILVRDVDPDTGDPIAESKAVEYSGRVGRGILKR